MRTALVLTIVFLSLPVALVHPFYGTLLWAWAAYFRPHDFAWGAEGLPLSKYIAAATCLGFLVAAVTGRERFVNIFTRETLLLLVIFVVLIIVCDAALYSRADAWAKFNDYWKIFLMTLMTATLINSAARLRMMVWAVALSLGALGLKGGLLGALRGARIHGPGGFILDNNDFALALNMALPMLYYLFLSERERLHRWLFGCMTVFTVLAVILTRSRGGFLGLATVLFFLAMKSRQRVTALLTLFFVGVVGLGVTSVVAPDFLQRLATLRNYREDKSAMGRINAWITCWNIAMDRPWTGVGPRNLDRPETFARWAPVPEDQHVAHNIYFQALSDGGFSLLVPFVLLLAATYFSVRRLRRRTPAIPENRWFLHYCHMFEVSLLAYGVSGFFLSRNDFDLYYHIVGIVVAMKRIAPKVVVTPAASPSPPARRRPAWQGTGA